MREDDAYAESATPAERQSWAKQNNRMYGGLIAIGVVILQGFLTAHPLGTSAQISVIAFAVALPLLAVLILLGELHGSDQAGQANATDEAVKAIAMLASITGVIAAFWHIDWVAGVAVLITGALALGVYGSHFSGSRLGQSTLHRFRRGGESPPNAGHQPPAPRHPYPTGPEAPTTVMPHPARQAPQQFPSGPTTEHQVPNSPGGQQHPGPQHPGSQQYPGQTPPPSGTPNS
ncbi:hypothetical protein [Nocardia goodfellowii]|uniref:Uncharacterized protein n=1 Tax=Nocardia goodfellowii TaxID=882446 RepID=A0ABS4QLU6_9NOCA|nr:hypothetical protein [Nocardia goodfellowii]MBP2192674.1 hypothetical protein [Nocardia goodfellowii]